MANDKWKALFSTATDDCTTPQPVFDQLNAEFAFTLDPCASATNAKCPRFFTPAEDGLRQDWSKETVFMNPPYGRVIGLWVRKAYESAQAGAVVVCLLPARTDTRWRHDYVMRGEFRFIRGRLRFGDGKNSAPFPSAIVIFRACDVSGDGCPKAQFDAARESHPRSSLSQCDIL